VASFLRCLKTSSYACRRCSRPCDAILARRSSMAIPKSWMIALN
jgi:hypothetical protein